MQFRQVPSPFILNSETRRNQHLEILDYLEQRLTCSRGITLKITWFAIAGNHVGTTTTRDREYNAKNCGQRANSRAFYCYDGVPDITRTVIRCSCCNNGCAIMHLILGPFADFGALPNGSLMDSYRHYSTANADHQNNP